MNTPLAPGRPPLLSVIMPAYRSAATIGGAIDSILRQTFFDFELLVIYDESPDDTVAILREYAARDQRIRLIHNQLPPGAWRKMVSAMNLGMTNARGQFLARMDADDIAVPNRFAMQLDFLARNPDVDLCGTWVVLFDEAAREIGRLTPACGAERIRILSYYAAPLIHPTWMMRRELFEQLGGYRDMTAEDYDFLLRALDAGFGLDNCPEFGLFYRQQPSHRAFVPSHRSGNYALQMRNRRRRGQPDDFDPEIARRLGQECGWLEERGRGLLEYGFALMRRHRAVGYATVGLALLLLPESLWLAFRKLVVGVRLALHNSRHRLLDDDASP